jgi:hypothetical protein
MNRHLTAALAITLFIASSASSAAAQDARGTLARKTRPGDRLTVDMSDRGKIEGRLVSAGAEILTIETAAGPATIPYSSIDRVRRRRTGVLLGSIIGLGVGVACGIPWKMLADNETGDGTAALLTAAGIGLGVGLAIDAALNLNRTVYRRSDTTVRFELAPNPRGATLGIRARW